MRQIINKKKRKWY